MGFGLCKICLIASIFNHSLIISFDLAKSFSYTEKTYCKKTGYIQSYRTLKEAQEACSANSECDLINHGNCNSGRWQTCKGNARRSLRSCTWKKIGNSIISINILWIISITFFIIRYTATFITVDTNTGTTETSIVSVNSMTTESHHGIFRWNDIYIFKLIGGCT